MTVCREEVVIHERGSSARVSRVTLDGCPQVDLKLLHLHVAQRKITPQQTASFLKGKTGADTRDPWVYWFSIRDAEDPKADEAPIYIKQSVRLGKRDRMGGAYLPRFPEAADKLKDALLVRPVQLEQRDGLWGAVFTRGKARPPVEPRFAMKLPRSRSAAAVVASAQPRAHLSRACKQRTQPLTPVSGRYAEAARGGAAAPGLAAANAARRAGQIRWMTRDERCHPGDHQEVRGIRVRVAGQPVYIRLEAGVRFPGFKEDPLGKRLREGTQLAESMAEEPEGWSGGYVKLGDFGCAKRMDLHGRTHTLCGTPGYVAPENILGRGYNHSVDWWTLGVLMYVLLTARQPFASPRTTDPVELVLAVIKTCMGEENQRWSFTTILRPNKAHDEDALHTAGGVRSEATEHLGTWAPGHLGTWAPGHLGTWAPGHLGTWAPGHLGLGTWAPGHLDTWIPGRLGLGIWAPGHLDTYPPYMTGAARDLISRLLVRKAAKSIGMLQGGAQDIKTHPWFVGFDWEALLARRMDPPRKPKETDSAKRKSELAAARCKEPREAAATLHESAEWDRAFKDF
ncbi:Protein kinase DC1 [Tetrabaena socialis]|uniref:Protein kinase DC1 n=1 Tax=Tetrabaena socialis TaxID=47790 RepID=A0A2J8AA99_9CHLO|nr:Protein kinase DC1 [Tetrabaena socialis]|eukprot:PNH09435.1 Protein kinase DC1 [Tetrabaena socialis]